MLNMTLAQIDGYSKALSVIERDGIKLAAIAARVAQSDDKGWKSWLREIG